MLNKTQVNIEIQKNIEVAKGPVLNTLKNMQPTLSKNAIIKQFQVAKAAYIYATLKKLYEKSDKTAKALFKEGYTLGYQGCVAYSKEVLSKQDYRLRVSTALIGIDIISQTILSFLFMKFVPDPLGEVVYDTVKTVANMVGNKYGMAGDILLDEAVDAMKKSIKKIDSSYGTAYQMRVSTKAMIGKFMLMNSIIPVVSEESSRSVAIDMGIGKYFSAVLLIVENTAYLAISSSMKDFLKMRLPAVIIHISSYILQTKPELRKYAYLLRMVFNMFALYVGIAIRKGYIK